MFLKSAFCAVLATAAVAPSFAASDYLLKLDGVKGEAASTIEVLSWSWGASNAGSMSHGGGMGAGKASSEVKAPRDVATGQSSGRRAIGPDMEPDMITLTLPAGSKLCAKGEHIKDAVLTGKGNTKIHLEDAIVTACTASGATARAELKGHVTLIK